MIEGKPTTVNLEQKHIDFLNARSRGFNFSAFVREKLSEYMKMMEVNESG